MRFHQFARSRQRSFLLPATLLASLVLAGAGCFSFDDGPEPEPEPSGNSGLRGTVQLLSGSSAFRDQTELDALREKVGEARDAAHARTAEAQRIVAEADREAEEVSPTAHLDGPTIERAAALNHTPRAPDWRPGELIVGFEKGTYDGDALEKEFGEMLEESGYPGLLLERDHCLINMICKFTMFDADGKRLDKSVTKDIEAALKPRLRADMRFVEANHLVYGMRVPNDPFYVYQQWHYEFPNLPVAWDISTGDPSVVVAVLDSGIVSGHPDIEARLVDGVDAIEDAQSAADGDGRDFDPVDSAQEFHGTHVLGTIGAESNNAEGVTGVTWGCTMQSVRVLGAGLSGASYDVALGLIWALGGIIEDFPANATPAKVINMSLGGNLGGADFETFEAVFQEVITINPAAYGNPIILTAAGNDNENVNNVTPASLPEAIAVGAHRADGQRAAYSNWGNAIDFMAPGGQIELDQNIDGQPDGVLSTWNNAYEYDQGTSMATPHAAGIAALAVSVAPNLTQEDVRVLLRSTANSAGLCAEGCGTGHVDALAALLSAGGVQQGAPQLALDRTRIIFGADETYREANVTNIGTDLLEYSVEIVGPQAGLFSVSAATGQVAAGLYLPIGVTLSRNGFTAGSANLKFSGYGDAAGQEVYVDLAFSDVQNAPALDINVVEVGAYKALGNGNYELLGDAAYARDTEGFEWEILGLFAGETYIFAIGDDNNDGTFDPNNESFGAWPVANDPKPIDMEANTIYRDVDFGLNAKFTTATDGYVGSPCTQDGDCNFATDGICITDWNGGYCSRICDDGFCGPGATCEILECGPGTPCNICLETCAGATSCRQNENYQCDEYNTCTPPGF